VILLGHYEIFFKCNLLLVRDIRRLPTYSSGIYRYRFRCRLFRHVLCYDLGRFEFCSIHWWLMFARNVFTRRMVFDNRVCARSVFGNTVFTGTVFTGTVFGNTVFTGTVFTGTVFGSTVFTRTVFTGTVL